MFIWFNFLSKFVGMFFNQKQGASSDWSAYCVSELNLVAAMRKISRLFIHMTKTSFGNLFTKILGFTIWASSVGKRSMGWGWGGVGGDNIIATQWYDAWIWIPRTILASTCLSMSNSTIFSPFSCKRGGKSLGYVFLLCHHQRTN